MEVTLAYSEGANVAIILGLLSHLVFKRYEPPLFPTLPILFLSLFFFVPVLLFRLYSLPSPVHAFPHSLILHSTYVVSLFLSITLYRISPLHPLYGFPGPVLARVSKFWKLLKIVRKGEEQWAVRELHETWGDFVRIGPNELSIRNQMAIHPIYGKGGFIKGPFYNGFMAPKGVTPFGVLRSHEEHAARRRVFDQGFTPSALSYYLEAMIPHLQEFVAQLGKRADGVEIKSRAGEWSHHNTAEVNGQEREGRVVDMSAWMGYFAYDFMGELLFGASFDLKTKGDTFGMWSILDAALKGMADFGEVPWLVPILTILPTTENQKGFQEQTIELVQKRKSQGGVRKDLFFHITGEDKDSNVAEPSLPAVVADAHNLMAAGAHTTSASLTLVLYFVLSNPSLLQTLLAELDPHFPPHEPFPFESQPSELFDKLSNLPFLNACITEAMRVQPPAPGPMQRTSTTSLDAPAGMGVEIAGRYIPPNVQVSVPIFAIHRDERYFTPEPDKFRPERWLEQEDGKFKTDKSANLTFLHGPYGCVGKNLAGHKLRITLAVLLHHFKLEFAPGFESEKYLKTIKCQFGITKGDLPLIIRRRNSGAMNTLL